MNKNCIHGCITVECMICNDTDSTTDREMEASARDWEIIRNRSFGTNDRVWSTDEDYKS